MKYESKPYVYYYCNFNVFNSILLNGTLWLSDIKKSNDYHEIQGIIEVIKQELNFYLENSCRGQAAGLESTIKNKALDFYQYCCQKLKNVYNEIYWLAMCFSEKKNNLYQWCEYGDNCNGFSIGFKKETLRKFFLGLHIPFKKIEYDEDHNRNFAKSMVKNLCGSLEIDENLLALFDKSGHFNDRKGVVDNWCNEISQALPYYKDDSFNHEKEFRLCYTVDKKSLTTFPNELAFYHRNNDLVLRYEAKIPIAERDKIIKEILIGPSSKITEEELYMYLINNGINFPREKIYKSQIPYIPRKLFNQ